LSEKIMSEKSKKSVKSEKVSSNKEKLREKAKSGNQE